MKKLMYSAIIIFTMSILFTNCRETKEDKVEDAVENVGDAVEDAGDEIEDALD